MSFPTYDLGTAKIHFFASPWVFFCGFQPHQSLCKGSVRISHSTSTSIPTFFFQSFSPISSDWLTKSPLSWVSKSFPVSYDLFWASQRQTCWTAAPPAVWYAYQSSRDSPSSWSAACANQTPPCRSSGSSPWTLASRISGRSKACGSHSNLL